MIERRVLENMLEIFPLGINQGEDIVAWIRIISVTRSLHHIDVPLSIVRLHPDSNSKSSRKVLRSMNTVELFAWELGVRRPHSYSLSGIRLILKKILK